MNFNLAAVEKNRRSSQPFHTVVGAIASSAADSPIPCHARSAAPNDNLARRFFLSVGKTMHLKHRRVRAADRNSTTRNFSPIPIAISDRRTVRIGRITASSGDVCLPFISFRLASPAAKSFSEVFDQFFVINKFAPDGTAETSRVISSSVGPKPPQ